MDNVLLHLSRYHSLKYFWLCFALLLSFSAMAQKQSKIKGILEDSLSNPLIHATVLLLEPSDSTQVDFTRSALDGSFKFKNVAAGSYLITSTYLGYSPLQINVTIKQGVTLELGVLQMTELATELSEVVIKGDKPQIKMKGDTIEYDATTFKVTQGSYVEDLLKKLPGIEVDIDGSIRSDGRNVSKVTVDGKTFFGDNPKAATQTLPAESIAKVQVMDRKTEEEKITGSTAESLDREINLELKKEFKDGGFGRVIAAAGGDDRAELKGNFNRFNEKMQLSILGVGHNTGRNGFSWDGSNDLIGFQSSNLGGRFSSPSSRVRGNRGNTSVSGSGGLPEYYNGGFNFNYEHKKMKLGGSYFYNQANLFSESNSVQDRFFQDFIETGIASSERDNESSSHRLEFHVEQEIDSLHTIKVTVNGTCLLYTSPSPRDQRGSRMPSSA